LQKTSKSAVLREVGKPLEIVSVPIPEVRPGAILVKIEMAGVCGTDVHIMEGKVPVVTPTILGHENVGTIVKIGKDVHVDAAGVPVYEGDRVVCYAPVSCGRCYFCNVLKQPTRCINRISYGGWMRCDEYPYLVGGFSEYIYLLTQNNIVKISKEVPLKAAVLLGCAMRTIIHGLERIGHIKVGDIVVIQGSGPVGISGLIIARESGASKVIVIGAPRSRLELAKKFGADYTIDIEEVRDQGNRVKQILELTDGLGADIVLECAGVPSAVKEGIDMVRDGGKYLILGHYANSGTIDINPHFITKKQISIFGSWSSEPRHLVFGVKLMERIYKKYPFEEMISKTFPLEKVNDAIELMKHGKVMKSVIVP